MYGAIRLGDMDGALRLLQEFLSTVPYCDNTNYEGHYPVSYTHLDVYKRQAMEYKRPVISTNEGGIPDMVKDGENGWICEKQNPYSLADCIAKLLDRCV